MRTLTRCVTLAAALSCFPACAQSFVAIDVGHNPGQGAKSFSGVPEYTFNLAFAKQLAAELSIVGLAPTLLPQGLPLARRGPAAAGARLLISVHHDSVQPSYLPQAKDFSGYSLFVSRRQPDFRQALSCARYIGSSLRSVSRHFSPHHAEPIKGENRPWLDPTLGVYAFDDLIVLKSSPVPAVLFEAAVIVNSDEERLASNPAWVSQQARAVARGIAACLSHPKSTPFP